MIEEEDISAIKRKNRQADNIMLNNNVDDDVEDEDSEEGSQLVHNGEANGETPMKARGAFNLNDSNDDDFEEDAGSYKK